MFASATATIGEFRLRWANLRKEMREVNAQLEILTEWKALDAKLRVVLPPEYQADYEAVQPISMGSAGLKFDSGGRVAWDEIWGSFCDLAMAGGPPHKGKLLEAESPAAIKAEPERYRSVVNEICRGIRMVTDLAVNESPNPGWVRVLCSTPVMAGWMARAIVMENVSAYLDGSAFDLPAGPHFRVEKEIKNVITSIAKAHHYFNGHIDRRQQRQIAELFSQDSRPLLQPYRDTGVVVVCGESLKRARSRAATRILDCTGLPVGGIEYPFWLGVECPSVQAAIWMMRALVVCNTVARREEKILYVPIHPLWDSDGQRVSEEVLKAYRVAKFRGLFAPAS